jgi:hypothetical protein
LRMLALLFFIISSLLGYGHVNNSESHPEASKRKHTAPPPAALRNLPAETAFHYEQGQKLQNPKPDVYSVKITEQPPDRTSVVLSIIAVVVSIASAWFAKNASESLIKAERAWVLVEMKDTPGQGLLGEYRENGDGKLCTRVWVRFFFTNGGKTPARITKLRCGLAIYDRVPTLPNISIMTDEPFAVMTLAPGESSAKWPIDLIRDVPDVCEIGKSWAYLVGQVEYLDVFDKTRQTYFGYRIRGDHAFDPIPDTPGYQKHS